MELFRKILGKPPRDTAVRLPKIIEFCHALVTESEDGLPATERSNMAFMAAWCAIALYTQLPRGLDRTGLPDDFWRLAAEQMAALQMRTMAYRTPEDDREIRDVEAAMADHVTAFVHLWIALFGADGANDRFGEIERMTAELALLFENPELGLANALWLSHFKVSDMEDADRQEIREICQRLALQFNFCYLSRL